MQLVEENVRISTLLLRTWRLNNKRYFIRSCSTSWRKNIWHRYGMKKLRHCHTICIFQWPTQNITLEAASWRGPKGRKSMPKAGEKVLGEMAASRFPTSCTYVITVSRSAVIFPSGVWRLGQSPRSQTFLFNFDCYRWTLVLLNLFTAGVGLL